MTKHETLFPLCRTLARQPLDPFEIYTHVAAPGLSSFLLESGKGPSDLARYSFIGTAPYLSFTSKGESIEMIGTNGKTTRRGHPFRVLREVLTRIAYPRREGVPPFFGGAVGYFAYDLVRCFESIPQTAKDDLHLPDIQLMFVDTVVAIDHVERCLHLLFAPPWDRCTSEPSEKLYAEGLERLSALEARIDAPCGPGHVPSSTHPPPRIRPDMSKQDYVRKVQTCQEYIAAGEIYQANLSHRFTVDLNGVDPRTLYRRLRAINPAPFSAYLEFDTVTIVSASPERLVRLHHGVAETRPLAGTRGRGTTLLEDRRLIDDLLGNHKERAEHVMLVDLERNDLGRVCDYGTVDTVDFMNIEQCSHVNHIVSTVRGRLATQRDLFDLIEAMLPGGTITGAPKIRCMRILDELEPTARGLYTGSLGYINLTGDLDLNILIRTMIVKERRAYIQVGAGIVADSDPEREYLETLLKAEALFAALAS